MFNYTGMMLGLLFIVAASAAEIGSVRLDDKVNVGGQELVLNGAGVRTRVATQTRPCLSMTTLRGSDDRFQICSSP